MCRQGTPTDRARPLRNSEWQDHAAGSRRRAGSAHKGVVDGLVLAGHVHRDLRATVRRVETLIQCDRLIELTEIDFRDLNRSYSWAYAQRLGGVFDWCHRVYWDLSERRKDASVLHQLFLYSSFIWRLNGDTKRELEYAERLSRLEQPEDFDIPEALAFVLRYCNARISTLIDHFRQ